MISRVYLTQMLSIERKKCNLLNFNSFKANKKINLAKPKLVLTTK